jgi:predicted nucleotidyltransferase component of viral defense system
MQDRALADFNLVGGTALALYIGHRMSIDLDLFTPQPFDAQELRKHLADHHHFKSDFIGKHTLMGYIDNVKVDFITHAYPLVDKQHITEEGVRLISIRDIAAMKLSAIAGNGTRLKDFIDVAFLSTRMSLSDMLKDYERKFTDTTAISALRSLTYFDDIDHSVPIQIVDRAYRWENIENRLRDMVDSPDRIFHTVPLPL